MSARVNRNPAYWSIRTTVSAGSSTGSAWPFPGVNTSRSARFQTGCEIVMKVSY